MCVYISLPIVIIVHVCGLALRIVRVSDPSSAPDPSLPVHKSTTSRYGYRLDASRNLWDGSGLKVDSGLTDVGWASGGMFLLLSTFGIEREWYLSA